MHRKSDCIQYSNSNATVQPWKLKSFTNDRVNRFKPCKSLLFSLLLNERYFEKYRSRALKNEEAYRIASVSSCHFHSLLSFPRPVAKTFFVERISAHESLYKKLLYSRRGSVLVTCSIPASFLRAVQWRRGCSIQSVHPGRRSTCGILVSSGGAAISLFPQQPRIARRCIAVCTRQKPQHDAGEYLWMADWIVVCQGCARFLRHLWTNTLQRRHWRLGVRFAQKTHCRFSVAFVFTCYSLTLLRFASLFNVQRLQCRNNGRNVSRSVFFRSRYQSLEGGESQGYVMDVLSLHGI